MKSTLMALVFLFTSTPLFADEARNERRIERQQKRIEQGQKSGELTEKEANRLLANEERIEEKQEEFLDDGDLSKNEKRRLEKMQDKQSKMIHRKKHNPRDRNDSRY